MAFAPYPPYPPGTRDPQRLGSSDDTRCSTPDTSYEDQVLSSRHILSSHHIPSSRHILSSHHTLSSRHTSF